MDKHFSVKRFYPSPLKNTDHKMASVEEIPHHKPFTMRESSLDIPDEIWDKIISNLELDSHLQPLSMVCKSFLSITNRYKKTLKVFEPTAHFLPSLLRRFPSIKHVSFSEFPHDPVPILLQIADFNFRLETLDLSCNECLPTEEMKLMPVPLLSGMKTLKLSGIGALGDADLEVLADLFPNLEVLDLSHPKEGAGVDAFGGPTNVDSMITDDGIAVLASKLKSLRRIDLKDNHWVTDKGVVSLVENCPNLEEIGVKECSFVTQTGIASALQACENLKTIGLHGMDLVVNDIRQPLSCAQRLSEIDFSYMDVSDALLYALVKAKLPLKSFTLFHCKSFTYAGILSFLKYYQCLDHLALEGVYILTDFSMLTIAKSLQKIRSVKLNYCGKLSDSTFFTLIKQCPSLETIEMEHTNMGNEDFVVTNPLSHQIKTLNLSYNKSLSNETMEKIALACPNLEILDLSSCVGISRKGVGEIWRKCHSLKHLMISGCTGVKNLDLDRNTQKLELLVASASGLTDEALIDIAKKCPDLVFLTLMNCLGLTSKGVKEVVDKCTKLKEINLTCCKNMGSDILPLMVFGRPSLRKIILPRDYLLTRNEENLYLKHGCQVKVGIN